MATPLQSAGIPTAPLESVVFNEDLQKRPHRAPDHVAEVRALSTLIQKLADSPETILQALVEEMLALFKADSAGISLLTTKEGEQRFHWPAIAGEWKPFIGGGTPRDFGPCGDVIDGNRSLLMRDLECRYDYYEAAKPRVEECLLVPFYLEGKAVGTVWIVAHGKTRQFDAEDLRQLESIGRFAATAHRTVNMVQELKKKSEHLERTTADLVRSNEDLERFAYVAAHDLSSPLVTIVRLGQLLERDLKDNENEQVNQSLKYLIGSAHRLTELVRDVLRYAAISQIHNDHGEIQAVSAEDACQSAIANLKGSIEQANAQVKCFIASDVRVEVPMVHLVQLFQNLIGNAIHYRKQDTPSLVEVRCNENEDLGNWMLTVADNGIGIKENYREMIFEPFKRLHGGALPGNGLGLAICKRIIERAYGSISFHSRIGEGTTFFFTLPKG